MADPAAQALLADLEASFTLVQSEIRDWFVPATATTSTKPAQQPVNTTANARPARLGLGATAAQARDLLSVEERRLRAQILGSASRKRRGEFDHEADVDRAAAKAQRRALDDGTRGAPHHHQSRKSGPSADIDASSKTVVEEVEDEDAEDSRASAVTARSAPVASAKANAASVGGDTVVPAAYAGAKRKKKQRKQQAAAAGAEERIHPALLAAMQQLSDDA